MKHFIPNNNETQCLHCGSAKVEIKTIHDGHINYRCKDCNVLETYHEPIIKDK